MSRMMRCLVVDDSALYRKVVRDVLATFPDVEVVGVASDGRQAIEGITSLRPDLITLDLEMPHLNGIGVLKELQKQQIDVAAIMVSAFTASGANTTNEALRLGAFDFILKPSGGSIEESVAQLRRDLEPKIRATRLRRVGPSRPAPAPPRTPAPPLSSRPQSQPLRLRLPVRKPSVVAIAVSTGGPQALTQLLPKLPANFPVPVLIVQHMPPMFTKSLADDLNRRCALSVSEASQGQLVRTGEVLIAPGGKQMRVAQSAAGPVIQLTDDPPERNCKPAADFLFRSVASVYGARAVGVVLTGMGDDGAQGAEKLKQAGASILAQDEASCVVYGMPKAVADRGLVDLVSPLCRMHDHLIAAAAGSALV